MGQDPPSDPDISTRQTLRLPIIDLEKYAQMSVEGGSVRPDSVSEAIARLGESVRRDVTTEEHACRRINPG